LGAASLADPFLLHQNHVANSILHFRRIVFCFLISLTGTVGCKTLASDVVRPRYSFPFHSEGFYERLGFRSLLPARLQAKLPHSFALPYDKDDDDPAHSNPAHGWEACSRHLSAPSAWMLPLNPFLAAFFKPGNPILSQCTPVHHHILLVPSTETLLTSRDTEGGSNSSLSDLVATEEFLGSHVLRVPSPSTAAGGKDSIGNLRDVRGKARQYSTVNGRTIIIKDSSIYTSKGEFFCLSTHTYSPW
jgi:hypothetical protein